MARRIGGLQILTSLSFFFLGLLSGVLLFTFIKAGTIYEYTDTLDGAKLPPSDAIVVLAMHDERIQEVSLRRVLPLALDLADRKAGQRNPVRGFATICQCARDITPRKLERTASQPLSHAARARRWEISCMALPPNSGCECATTAMPRGI